MEYDVETGSGAMIFLPSFIKIGSGIQKFRVGGFTNRHTDNTEIARNTTQYFLNVERVSTQLRKVNFV
jgi:hypothetical protein